MWVKKCVEMREMLFKNWKWLFENINQTPPLSLYANFLVFLFFYFLYKYLCVQIFKNRMFGIWLLMSLASQFQGCHFYVTRVLFTSITCDWIWLSQSTCERERERESIEFFFDDMDSHQGTCRDGHTHWTVDTWPTPTQCRYY